MSRVYWDWSSPVMPIRREFDSPGIRNWIDLPGSSPRVRGTLLPDIIVS
jgi:hypothetical protein